MNQTEMPLKKIKIQVQDGIDNRYTDIKNIQEISEFLRKKKLIDTLEDIQILPQHKLSILLLEEGIQKGSLTKGLFLDGFS